METYFSNLILWYPNGIKISIDFNNVQYKNLLSHGENIFSIDVEVNKVIDGMYLGSTPNNNVERIVFRIAFVKSLYKLSDFKIAGIRSSEEKITKEDLKQILNIKGMQFPSNITYEINQETKGILNDYSNYLSLIGDTTETLEDKAIYKESFLNLFEFQLSQIYNDILPGKKKNEYLKVSTYINMYSEAYATTGGKVTFKIDSADLGPIFKKNYSLYYRRVELDKHFEGLYLGKQKIVIDEKLRITITFIYSNNMCKRFKINLIDLIDETKTTVNEIKLISEIKPVKVKELPEAKNAKTIYDQNQKTYNKFLLETYFKYGISKIKDGNLQSMTISKNYHSWKISSKYGFSAGLSFGYMISSHFGVHLGGKFMKAATTFSLNSSQYFEDKTEYYDINNDLYYKRIKANYDSLVTYNFITLPISASYTIDLHNSIKLRIMPVLNINIVQKATSTQNGTISLYGYYPNQTQNIFKEIDWPEFGFYNNTYSSVEKDIKSKSNTLYLSAELDVGISYFFTDNIGINLSMTFDYGIGDLSKNNGKYADIFAPTKLYNRPTTLEPSHVHDHKSTKILQYGGKLGFLYNF